MTRNNVGSITKTQLDNLRQDLSNPVLPRKLLTLLETMPAHIANGFDFTSKYTLIALLEDILRNTTEIAQLPVELYEQVIDRYLFVLETLTLANEQKQIWDEQLTSLSKKIDELARYLKKGQLITVDSVKFLVATQRRKQLLINSEVNFFPNLDETLADPDTALNVCSWYQKEINQLKKTGAINGICVVEKPYSTIGAISLIGFLAVQCQLPITIYRAPRWTDSLKVTGNIPKLGSRLALVYDVSITGIGIIEVARYLKKRYKACVNNAIVLFDFDRVGSAEKSLKQKGIELYPFLTETNTQDEIERKRISFTRMRRYDTNKRGPVISKDATMKESYTSNGTSNHVSSDIEQYEFAEALPVKYFSVERSLESIPEPEPCALCGSPMEKTLLPYRCHGATTIVETDEAPGYECTNFKCGAELLDPRTALELITTAANLLTMEEDLPIRERLYQEATELCSESDSLLYLAS